MAYYDKYGDIVRELGSYPVLGNPNYHQPTDLLETVNHQLLFEATKANIAAIMLLASSPYRVDGLSMSANKNEITATWKPNPEKSVIHYYVPMDLIKILHKKFLPSMKRKLKSKLMNIFVKNQFTSV